MLRGGQEAGVEEHLVQGSVEPVGDILLDCGDLLEQGERLYRRVEGGLVHHLEEQVRVLVKAIKKKRSGECLMREIFRWHDMGMRLL